MKTAVVEKDVIGGRCLNYACIPAKAVLRSADILTEVREAGDFGIKVAEPEVDFGAVAERRKKVIKTLTGGVAGLMKKNKIDVIEGYGALTDDGNVKVGGNFDGTEIQAGKVILATGSVPKPIPGTTFGGRVIGTEGAWQLDELPGSHGRRRRRRVGRGDRSAYARLGSEVLLFEALDRVLPTEDADISKLAERGLKKQGMKVHTKTLVENVEAGDSVGDVHLRRREGRGRLPRHRRRPRPGRRGRSASTRPASSSTTTASSRSTARMRTSRQNVYAIGDLVPGPALAHKASDEGIIAAEDAVGAGDAPARPTSTSRARRSARRTSARSG